MMGFRSVFKIVTIFGMLMFFACHDTSDKSDFGLTYPAYFPEPHYRFGKNTLSEAGFEVGKSLFYDPILSVDNSVSCASCHAQGHAFADHNVVFSEGIHHKKGNRNSPALFNLAWNTSFMWDGGINHIEVMPVAPITNEVEMGESISNVMAKLNSHPSYPTAFEQVFGTRIIDDQKLFYVLAQFMSMLVSDNSRYDQYRKGEIQFTQEEKEGLAIFKQKCASCHTEPLFTDFSFRNNGLQKTDNETGRHRITQEDSDINKFKVPSLRNIALTYPYMHDGRFRTLKQVLDHYSDGVDKQINLDPLLWNSENPGIELSETEKNSLIVFLQTLTDYKFVSDPLFAPK